MGTVTDAVPAGTGTATGSSTGRVLVAVDGGGSKTDVVALGLDGAVLATARGVGSCPQVVGVGPAVAVVDGLVREVLDRLGRPDDAVELAGVYLSGLDLPVEIETFRDAIADLGWVRAARRGVVVENDTFALLRAGTDAREAIAVVCGTGINAVARRADGATVRFPALGRISGDWGGGADLGEWALWHAARAVDGRGPWTVLVDLVPRALGRPDVATLVEDLHLGRLGHEALAELPPVLFAAAADGDAVAASVVDRQGDEVVALATAALRRLDLLGADVPVVLGGGVLAAGDARLIGRVTAGLAARAPGARVRVVTAPPVLGTALLVLEAVDAAPAALARARAALTSP